MQRVDFDGTFAGWRKEARRLLQAGIAPAQVSWQESRGLGDLFDEPVEAEALPPSGTVRIPPQLAEALSYAACFRSDDRWALLYQVLWRVARGERAAMLAGDEDGSELQRRVKAIRREIHHVHAFLRFRPRAESAGPPAWVAWHQPAHDVLALAAPHFCDRMGNSSWLIATPEAAALWDGQALQLVEPCPAELQQLARQTPEDDDRNAGDELWRTYYRSTFNPARANPRTLRGNMPARFWKDLPEGPLIPALLSEARAGAQRLAQAEAVGRQSGREVLIAAERAQPERPLPTTLDECRRCELWEKATQPVAGEGPRTARILLLGEQPGDQEDLAGRPFVGPAGQVLMAALAEAGLERSEVFLTNAVKHFKWIPQGRRRKHVTPGPEIAPCRYWLEQELRDIQPTVVVALGSTALEALLERKPRGLAQFMGRPLRLDERWIIATYHPSYILRTPDAEQQAQARRALVAALREARTLAAENEGEV